MARPARPSPCPPGEALTAHAHGEGDGPTRAALARHLLACPACHAAHDSDASLFTALAALGAARSVAPPATAAPAPLRRASRGWTAWLPPLAAAGLVAVALLVPIDRPRTPLTVHLPTAQQAGGLSQARIAPLLGAQAPDGHWAAEAGPLGSQPCAATAVVLLALLRERAQAGPDLAEDASVAWALERGTDYLLDRLERPDRTLRDLSTAERAVLLAALSQASIATPSTRLASATRTLVDDVRRRLAGAAPEATSLPWLDYALAAATEADVPGAQSLRDDLESRGPGAPWRAQEPARLPVLPASTPSDPTVACTPVRAALDLLRDEPPLRTLALGPSCRTAPRLAQR